MNERIRELVKQAGGISYDDDNNELIPMLIGKGLEKFAELIVRECVSLMNEQKECYSNPEMYEPNVHSYVRMVAKADAFNEAAYIIKNYFKVE